MSNIYPTVKGMDMWQYVSVDLIEIKKGEHDESESKYVLVCIDNYSKAPELVLLKNKSSEQTA